MNRNTTILAALALVVAGSACGGQLGSFEVTQATISNVDWTSIAAVVGFTETPGTLNLVDTNGTAHPFAVTISGPVLGVLMDMSGGGDGTQGGGIFSSDASLDLPAGKKIIADDIAGGYFGNEEAAHLAIGVEGHDLTNGAGVKLSGSSFNFGVGFMIAFEWLSIGVN